MKAFISMWRMDPRIRPYVIHAGYIPLDTHHDRLTTYHLSCREMAARDTHVSCARRRDDDHFTGCCYHPWSLYRRTSSHWDMCARCGGVVWELLGVTPPVDALRGFAISIWWLCDQLSLSAPDADEVALERSTRGFILALMGSFLFTNKKGVQVHMCFFPLLRDLTHIATYSWVVQYLHIHIASYG